MSWELPYGEVQISQNPNDYPFRASEYDPYIVNRLIATFSIASAGGLTCGALAGIWSIGKLLWDDRWESSRAAFKYSPTFLQRFLQYGAFGTVQVFSHIMMNQLFKHLRGVPFIYPADSAPTLISGGFILGGYLGAQYAQNPETFFKRKGRFIARGLAYSACSCVASTLFENMWFQAVATTYIDFGSVAKQQQYTQAQMNLREGSYGQAGTQEVAPPAFPRLNPQQVSAPRR